MLLLLLGSDRRLDRLLLNLLLLLFEEGQLLGRVLNKRLVLLLIAETKKIPKSVSATTQLIQKKNSLVEGALGGLGDLGHDGGVLRQQAVLVLLQRGRRRLELRDDARVEEVALGFPQREQLGQLGALLVGGRRWGRGRRRIG